MRAFVCCARLTFCLTVCEHFDDPTVAFVACMCSSVAFFHTRSHWHPVTPLGFAATIQWCAPPEHTHARRHASVRLATPPVCLHALPPPHAQTEPSRSPHGLLLLVLLLLLLVVLLVAVSAPRPQDATLTLLRVPPPAHRMQRSRFCVCPPGDVPYNKRYFTALLAGCVPVLFSFRGQLGERNWWKPRTSHSPCTLHCMSALCSLLRVHCVGTVWALCGYCVGCRWKPRKGPGQRDIDPFHAQINHSELVVEVTVEREADIRGFLDRLRAIPDAVVDAKQRAIERVRHRLLYDMSGSREDAFTCVLRQLVAMLPPPDAADPQPPVRGRDGSAHLLGRER